MAKKIIKGKIGNAITSVAEDHIVVVSDDVFDEKHQKYQSEINDISMSGGYWNNTTKQVLFDRLKSNLAQCINDGTIYFVTDSNGNFTQIALGDGSKSHVVGIGPKMDDATKQELMSKLGLTISSNMGTIQLGKLSNHNGVSSQKVVTYERTGLGTDTHEISTVGYVQQYMKTAKAMVYAGLFNAQTKEITDYNNAIISPSGEGNVTFDYLLSGPEGETLLTSGMSFIVGTAGNLEGYTGINVYGGQTNVEVGDMIIIINVQPKESVEGGSMYNEASILVMQNTNLKIADGAITTAKLADTAVTPSKLSTDIQSLISNLSKTATYAGIATPTTNPGTPDGHVFYFASQAGAYSNFGNTEIDSTGIFTWDGTSWSFEKLNFGDIVEVVQSTGTSETAVMSQKAVTEINNKVDVLSEELEGIDALKGVINKRLSPFNKVTFDNERYYSGGVNLFISGDAVDKNISINQLKLRVNKVSGASYKLRLVECEASGMFKITKLSNEISLTEPSGDFNDETISLGTTFEVAAGHKYGLMLSDVGIIKCDRSNGVSKYLIRDIVYSQKVVGANLLPYAQESAVGSVNINFIFVGESFITPVKKEDFEKSIGQKSDSAIESDNLWGAIEEVNDKSLSSRALLDMKLDNILADVEYEVGGIDSRTGNNTENNRCTRTKNIYWLNKGTHVFSTATTPFGFFKYDNNLHFERVALSNGNDYEITESGYYRWVINFPIDVTTLGDSIKHGGYIYFGYMQQYDYEERNAINYAATQVNPFILSRKEEKMAHDSNFQFDNDGTMWLAYIGNETTTDENEKQVVNGVAVCYCNIVHVNPYTGEELGRATFKAGESIGDYTQPNEVAPYGPHINLISEGKVHVQFWAHMNGESTLAKFDVDKSSIEKTNFAAYTIKYNGVTRVLNPTGLKETYEAISGETIEDFDHVNMNTHYSLYDGYWYSVINNVFGTPSIPNFANQKFRSILVRSIDCVNWEVVHCYQEIPFTSECCMCIKNGVVYTTDRNNYVSAFNLTTKEVRKTLIPLGAGCKTSVFNYKGDVVFAATIPCEYDVDKQSYRGNLGLYKINEDLSIELLSRIMTNHGMHYPDLGSDGFDIFMSWSEDRRHIMLKLQRSNIGFSRIQL